MANIRHSGESSTFLENICCRSSTPSRTRATGLCASPLGSTTAASFSVAIRHHLPAVPMPSVTDSGQERRSRVRCCETCQMTSLRAICDVDDDSERRLLALDPDGYISITKPSMFRMAAKTSMTCCDDSTQGSMVTATCRPPVASRN